MKPRVAIVTQDLRMDGGLFTAASFLFRILGESGRFEPEMISLASSAADPMSVSLRSPATWRRGIGR